MHILGPLLLALAVLTLLVTPVFSVATLVPTIALPCLGALVVAGVAARKDPRFRKPRSWWLLLPVMVPTLITAFGIVFAHRGPDSSSLSWPRQAIDCMIWSQVPIAVLLLAILRINPLIVLGVSVFAWYESTCAAFNAVMLVTNTWL